PFNFCSANYPHSTAVISFRTVDRLPVLRSCSRPPCPADQKREPVREPPLPGACDLVRTAFHPAQSLHLSARPGSGRARPQVTSLVLGWRHSLPVSPGSPQSLRLSAPDAALQ